MADSSGPYWYNTIDDDLQQGKCSVDDLIWPIQWDWGFLPPHPSSNHTLMIIIICSFFKARYQPAGFSRCRCVKAPAVHLGNQTWGSQAGFVHTTRDQKLWTRNMKGFQFLGVGGNLIARRKPTKVGMESANQQYNHCQLHRWKKSVWTLNQSASPLE